MTAREETLSRIQTALGPTAADSAASATAYATMPRHYARLGKLDRKARLDLFIDRLADYEVEVLQVGTEPEIPSAIARALHNAEEDSALIASAFPAAWLPPAVTFIPDNNLPISAIEGVPAVITTCESAVASTGTLTLVHEGAQGRRILTLLPDHHICLVRRDQVFELLPEALAALTEKATRPITTISGPSATSDIEMTRVRGVHGPRRLTVILYA